VCVCVCVCFLHLLKVLQYDVGLTVIHLIITENKYSAYNNYENVYNKSTENTCRETLA